MKSWRYLFHIELCNICKLQNYMFSRKFTPIVRLKENFQLIQADPQMLLCLPRQMLLAGIINDTFSGTKGQKSYANISVAILSSKKLLIHLSQFWRENLNLHFKMFQLYISSKKIPQKFLVKCYLDYCMTFSSKFSEIDIGVIGILMDECL